MLSRNISHFAIFRKTCRFSSSVPLYCNFQTCCLCSFQRTTASSFEVTVLRFLGHLDIMGVYLSAPVTTKSSQDGGNDAESTIFGVSSMQGWRHYMEDAHIVFPSVLPHKLAMYGVFDGHGGAAVSLWAAKHILEIFSAESQKYLSDESLDSADDVSGYSSRIPKRYGQALQATFLQLDAQMRLEENREELKAIHESMKPVENSPASQTAGSRVMCCNSGSSPSFFVMCETSEGYVVRPYTGENAVSLEDGMMVPSDKITEIFHSIDIANTEESSGPSLESVYNDKEVPNNSTFGQDEEENITVDDDTAQRDSDEFLSAAADEKYASPSSTSVGSTLNSLYSIAEVSENGSLVPAHEGMDAAVMNTSCNDAHKPYGTYSLLHEGRDYDVDLSSPEVYDEEEMECGDLAGEDAAMDLTDDHPAIYNRVAHAVQANAGVGIGDGNTPKEDISEICGATAIVVLVLSAPDAVLVVANAGDSRAVLCRNGKSIPLSCDHKPLLPSEFNRIANAGGKVYSGRVDGNLNLSRSIGDLCYKNNASLNPKLQKITAFPDLRILPITQEDEFVVVACDGIWDCKTNQEVVDFIKERMSTDNPPLSQICEELCDACLSTSPNTNDGLGCDNMTCLIVKFTDTLLKTAPAEQKDFPMQFHDCEEQSFDSSEEEASYS
ncbi:protein phosphatase 2C domain-containing protein [Cardiosporidium cionae]|uniref:protein-serine/threonine phosphatase n=1 Tax=Cardiosporidium cionae TaxID=476202 RepID=A0ABQ7J6H5_9APIC|nr:protein phosphatase 2C domain-containing protein [Cardiosporidium cionae]|eukprot:KAF8819578.1 protein phosphatase 2C domain-containing protein [Cardiosporidium cionae]